MNKNYNMLKMVNILHFVFLTSMSNVRAANILAVKLTPSITPEDMFTNLLKELTELGHEITLVTTNPIVAEYQALENVTIIDVQYKLKSVWQKHNNILLNNQNHHVVSEVSLTLHTNNHISEVLLQTDELKQLIEEKHSYFHLILLEASMIPLISLSHIFKVPVVLVSSTDALIDNYEIIGAPTHPILYPSLFQRRIYNLTAMEKVTEFFRYITLHNKIRSIEKKVDISLKVHFGSAFPTLSELKRNVLALFLNTHPIWSGNRPVPSNVVYLAEINSKYMEHLPQDLKSFLDKSRNGVIYVSFGTVIKPSRLSPEKLLRILNVFSHLPYDILLKWDNDRLPGAPKNIKIYKWLPQSSVLGHPKVKLFITHGGIKSTFEAINAGVPLIGIPMYCDQWYNTEKFIHFHIGLQMDLASLNEEKLIRAIYLVIKDETYRTSIAELRSLMHAQPISPMKRAIWWTEQVLQPNGKLHLRSPAANMSWTEYFEIDLILIVLLAVVATAIIFIVFIILIIRYAIYSFKDIKKKIT